MRRAVQTILLLGFCGAIVLGLGLMAYLILAVANMCLVALVTLTSAFHRDARGVVASIGAGVVWPVLLLALIVHAISAARERADAASSSDVVVNERPRVARR